MLRIHTCLAIIVVGLIGCVAGSEPAQAAQGVRFDVTIDQKDPATNSYVLLFKDTYDIVQGVPASGFFLNMSVDISLHKVDSSGSDFDVQVYTLSRQQSNYAQHFVSEFELPARIGDIAGKNGAVYRLTFEPRSEVDIDTTYCHFLTVRKGDFNVDPSANVNIHYVSNTLADYFWNSVREMMNNDYELFKKMNNFTLPGRFELFLCPCLTPGIMWDTRFSMMVDPVRSSLYAVYDQDFNSAYPFLMNQGAVLRNYGYSPPFLSEGYANYYSFAIYDMKNLVSEGNTPGLDSLLTTSTYFTSDPRATEAVSATFVRYLVDQYGTDKFVDCFRRADDLTLRKSLADVYGKSTTALEQEWRTYVDTVRIHFVDAAKYRDQAETMRYYNLAREYSGEMLDVAGARADTLIALGAIVRDCYFTGDYEGAIKHQKRLLALGGQTSANWMGLAGYEMMAGEYDSAAVHLDRAAALDSTNNYVTFNEGLNALVQGDTATARRLFAHIANNNKIRQADIESHVLLGFILKHSKDKNDQVRAHDLFSYIIDVLSVSGPRPTSNSHFPMWLGAAYLGIDDTGKAAEMLHLAEFLNSRPFYKGMVELWLGKTADIRGEPDVARKHYENVVSGKSAYYSKQEAERYLKTPYTQ